MTSAEDRWKDNIEDSLNNLMDKATKTYGAVKAIRTEMEHKVDKEGLVNIVRDETKKEFALHKATCDNIRSNNINNGGQKHDWTKTIRNSIYIAGLVAGTIGGIAAIM
jgi:hypothetical protein